MIGSLFPILYLKIKKKRRIDSFNRGFPDALDMIVSALRAGHAFNKSLLLVAEEAANPIGTEFRKTFEENSLGLPLQEALMNLVNRLDSEDLKFFVMAVLLQKETGGNLTEILNRIAYTIRERFKLMGQIKVFTAQGRMSMWTIMLLPPSFLLLMSVMNPAYIEPLFQEPKGQNLLAVACFFELIGYLVIKKITIIKFK